MLIFQNKQKSELRYDRMTGVKYEIGKRSRGTIIYVDHQMKGEIVYLNISINRPEWRKS